MQTCKTCKHWIRDDLNIDLALSVDYTPANYKIKYCKNPKMECNKLPFKNTASPHDDFDDNKVDFITGQDFGCVLHETI